MKFKSLFYLLVGGLLILSCSAPQSEDKTPVDYVNPNMGGGNTRDSHLLKSTPHSLITLLTRKSLPSTK